MMQPSLLVVQRWREGRDRYRPAGEVIQTADYDVAVLEADASPKAFVRQHHYSGTYPAARFRFGLFRRGELVGVAVFSHPVHDAVLTSVFPGRAIDSVELGRFVLLDSVPGNGETWFLGQCFRLLRREGLRGVVSFSDPVARRDEHDRVVFPGHLGTIYQAHNGAYLGRGRSSRMLLNPTAAGPAPPAWMPAPRRRSWPHIPSTPGGASPTSPSSIVAASRPPWPNG